MGRSAVLVVCTTGRGGGGTAGGCRLSVSLSTSSSARRENVSNTGDVAFNLAGSGSSFRSETRGICGRTGAVTLLFLPVSSLNPKFGPSLVLGRKRASVPNVLSELKAGLGGNSKSNVRPNLGLMLLSNVAVVDVELLSFRSCRCRSHSFDAEDVWGGGGIPNIGDGRGGLTKPVFLDVVVEAEIFLSCSFEDTPNPAARKAASCRACAAVAAALLRFFADVNILSEWRLPSCVSGLLLTAPAQTPAQHSGCATLGSGSRYSRSQSSASQLVGDLTPQRRIETISSSSQIEWPRIPPLLSFI